MSPQLSRARHPLGPLTRPREMCYRVWVGKLVDGERVAETLGYVWSIEGRWECGRDLSAERVGLRTRSEAVAALASISRGKR